MAAATYSFGLGDHDLTAHATQPFPTPGSSDLLGLFDDLPPSNPVLDDFDCSTLLESNTFLYDDTVPSVLLLGGMGAFDDDVTHNLDQQPIGSGLDFNVAWHGDDFFSFESRTSHQDAQNVAWQLAAPVQDHTARDTGGECQTTAIEPTEQSRLKSKAKRTSISPELKRLLNTFFSINAYPSHDEMVALARRTTLPESTIKNWFTNARSRKANASTQKTTPSEKLTEALSPQTISVANLDALNRASPAPSNASLDRYLATSRTEEPITVPVTTTDPWHSSTTPFAYPPPPKRPHSNAGSVESWRSMGSAGSFRSSDSRGSRRGRRGWTSQTPLPSEYTNDVEATSALQGNKRRKVKPMEKPFRYYCTSPDCDQRFRHRYEWERHEAAIHYCPYNWVCCSQQDIGRIMDYCFICNKANVTLRHIIDEHLPDCASKPTDQRTFFRQDQLEQHVRRHRDKKRVAGPTSRVPESLLTAWKEENPALNQHALHCGFCGLKFFTWSARSEHVFWHLGDGARKSTWWPDRLLVQYYPSQPVLPSSVGDRAQTTPRTSWSKFSCRNLPDSLSMLNATCFRCGEDAKHLITSHLQDAECASTICRPIHEWAKAGNSTSVRKFKLQCRLCPWDRHVLPDTILQYLTEFGKHVAQHSLRSCTQKIFRGHPKEFWWHMQKQHKATISVEQVFTQDRWRLDPWESEHTPENYDV